MLAFAPSSAFATGDANRGSCPNEASAGFRAYLADCRAYEKVSPTFKEGWPVFPQEFTNENAPGADAPLVRATSLGAFAGGSDTTTVLGNDYLFGRSGPGAWSTSAVDPPPSELEASPRPALQEGNISEYAPDGTALLVAHTPSESAFGSAIYRRTPTGAFELIGPMLSEQPTEAPGVNSESAGELFAGASSDLSKVLFYVQPIGPRTGRTGLESGLWPGDETLAEAQSEKGIARSLYEYEGVGQPAPRLVGVDQEEKLISQCGIALGGEVSGDGNTHNAVSADGSTVVFTAQPGGCTGTNRNHEEVTGAGPPARELFARVNHAVTVPISEPTPADCAECDTSSPAAASFVGASTDGERVFFITSQSLLPGATSGANLYEYDFSAPAGHRVTLVSRVPEGTSESAEVQGVGIVSEDATHVYFVAHGKLAGANSENRSPEAGGENLYVFERDAQTEAEGQPGGRARYVASLSEADQAEWEVKGGQPMQTTPTGSYLAFKSSKPGTTPDDTSTAPQLFRYFADQTEAESAAGRAGGAPPALVRVSKGEGGYNHDGNTESLGVFVPNVTLAEHQKANVDLHPAISSDGSVVTFASADALTPQAFEDPTNVADNMYEYRDGHVYLVSDGQSQVGSESFFVGVLPTGVSPSGKDIFFSAYAPLVPEDTDTLADLYDARVEGGAPAPATGGSCAQACAAAKSASPPAGPFTSETTPAGDQLAPPPAIPARPRPLTRAQQLARALKACHKLKGKRRARCEAAARKRYGPVGRRNVRRQSR
ncbi:MAG TPA: hypothetical protein VK707_10760 [Solirubrobacteraceae bacterium]|nr:hypothetical protein [Solirubrobacteraceae bacterium]